jgi:hypothetical protein
MGDQQTLEGLFLLQEWCFRALFLVPDDFNLYDRATLS